MKFRERKKSLPAVMVIPMIDIMFFLLVFFMLSTMYMTNLKTVAVKLGDIQGSVISQQNVAFAVSIDHDNNYFVGDVKVDLNILRNYAQKEIQHNPNAFVVVRTDVNSSYSAFNDLVGALKSVGVARFGIAAESMDK